MNIQKANWSRTDIPDLPSARIGSVLISNSKNNVALLFGGTSSSVGNLNDLWSINGLQSEQQQTSLSPGARYGMSMAWDESRQMAVLFGGLDNGRLLGDTWLFDGVEWQQKWPLMTPGPRVHATLAYDADRKLTVLFGGLADKGWKCLEALNEIWAWDGENWQQQFPNVVPSARFGARMVYDRIRQSTLLFGGGSGGCLLDDTWVWDGRNWKEHQPLHRPPARADFGLAYNEGKQQVILFGGQSKNDLPADTWIWDGQDWAQLQTIQSPPRQVAFGAQLAYLPVLEAVVLYNAFREKTIVSDESFTIIERSEVWVLDY
jgi:hypothetical protein